MCIRDRKLGVPFYDKEIIDMAVQESGFSREMIESAELKAKSSFAYNLASALNFSEGMSSSPLSVNEKLFLAQFQVIAEIGNKEEGVIVGPVSYTHLDVYKRQGRHRIEICFGRGKPSCRSERPGNCRSEGSCRIR